MDTVRAHANPCPVEIRLEGTMAEEATENVHRLESKVPTRSSATHAVDAYESQLSYTATGLSTTNMPSL